MTSTGDIAEWNLTPTLNERRDVASAAQSSAQLDSSVSKAINNTEEIKKL